MQGQAAIDGGDWPRARRILSDCVEQDPSAEALHALARVVERDGDVDLAIDVYQRAYRAFRTAGDTRSAALIAGRQLSFLYAAVHGNAAVSAGWLARARRLATVSGECSESGWVVLAEAMTADDARTEESMALEAAAIGRRAGDADLELTAIGYQGHALVRCGRVGQGMRLVDEATAASHAGEVRDYLAAGEIYCKMLVCCELTLDVRRAGEWLAVAEGFAETSGAVWVSAICRMHQGAVLTAAGRWTEAEHMLATSLSRYARSYRAFASGAAARLADLRVRQGRLRDAQQLLAGHEQDDDAAAPRAALSLATDEAGAAASLLRRRLASTGNPVETAPLLSLLAEAELAAGRLEEARTVARTLTVAAAGTGDPPRHLAAFAAYTEGRVAAAAGQAHAEDHLQAAAEMFAACRLPLQEARARHERARALRGRDPQRAVQEARRALTLLDRLGARQDADRTAKLLRELGTRGRATPRSGDVLTRREHNVLDLVADGLSNADIAQRLFLSHRTVEHHVANVLNKLGATSRAEAVAIALRRAQAAHAPPGPGTRDR